MQTATGTALNSNTTSAPRSYVKPLFIVAVVVVVCDQVTKLLAVAYLTPNDPIALLGDVLRLRLVRNPGAAFSLGTDMTFALTAIALGAVVFIGWLSRRVASLPWAVALGGILGGALGNLIDRVVRAPKLFGGHVVDFLELPHWPVFNLADSAIVGAAAIIAVLAIRGAPMTHSSNETTRDARD